MYSGSRSPPSYCRTFHARMRPRRPGGSRIPSIGRFGSWCSLRRPRQSDSACWPHPFSPPCFRSLLAFASGLLAFVAVKVLATGYFSRQDTRTPGQGRGSWRCSRTSCSTLVLVVPLGPCGARAGDPPCPHFSYAGFLLRGLMDPRRVSPASGWGRFIARVVIGNPGPGRGPVDGARRARCLARSGGGDRAIRLCAVIGMGTVLYAVVMVGPGVATARCRGPCRSWWSERRRGAASIIHVSGGLSVKLHAEQTRSRS